MTSRLKPLRRNTVQRIAAMRRVTELLSQGEMLGQDICETMRISASGLRKYLGPLMADHIVELARREPTKFGNVGQPVYKLSASAKQIEKFLAAEASFEAKAPTRRAVVMPGRRFHILADDAHYPVRALNVLPVHEPLHAAFWAGRVAA
jgi:hypothetical protein